jgi:hypothetical protein
MTLPVGTVYFTFYGRTQRSGKFPIKWGVIILIALEIVMALFFH